MWQAMWQAPLVLLSDLTVFVCASMALFWELQDMRISVIWPYALCQLAYKHLYSCDGISFAGATCILFEAVMPLISMTTEHQQSSYSSCPPQ